MTRVFTRGRDTDSACRGRAPSPGSRRQKQEGARKAPLSRGTLPSAAFSEFVLVLPPGLQDGHGHRVSPRVSPPARSLFPPHRPPGYLCGLDTEEMERWPRPLASPRGHHRPGGTCVCRWRDNRRRKCCVINTTREGRSARSRGVQLHDRCGFPHYPWSGGRSPNSSTRVALAERPL